MASETRVCILHFYSRASCEARHFTSVTVPLVSLISTHAPRVRRDMKTMTTWKHGKISTHAPRVRRDDLSLPLFLVHIHFYSRASCEARQGVQWTVDHVAISTHAPRVRRDVLSGLVLFVNEYFYSRASCEARQSLISPAFSSSKFLLTRLV